MATIKEKAQEQLGPLDLSYLDKEREAIKSSYNTSKDVLGSSFKTLLDNINLSRADASKNFNVGRSTIAESAYDKGRGIQSDLSGRVSGVTGLKQIGQVGNRMETGREFSNLANSYYGTVGKLDTTEKQSKEQYDLEQRGLEDFLRTGLAGINTREGEAKNSYQMSVGQLAEQIQARLDAQRAASASIEQARKEFEENKKRYAEGLKTQRDKDMYDIISNRKLNYGEVHSSLKNLLGNEYNETFINSLLRETRPEALRNINTYTGQAPKWTPFEESANIYRLPKTGIPNSLLRSIIDSLGGK